MSVNGRNKKVVHSKIRQQKQKRKRAQNFNTINKAYGLEPDIKMLDEVSITVKRIDIRLKKLPNQRYSPPVQRLDFTTIKGDKFNLS